MLLLRLHFLLISLLLLSYTAVGAAVSQDGNTGTDLTSTTFTDKLSKGMWLVEYFSPYCKHCKKFMPTWKSLVAMHEHLAESSDFHFARVNCIEQMDLCTKEKIGGYPSLIIYKKGAKSDEYNRDRSFELLSTYVLEHAAQYRKAKANKVDIPLKR